MIDFIIFFIRNTNRRGRTRMTTKPISWYERFVLTGCHELSFLSVTLHLILFSGSYIYQNKESSESREGRHHRSERNVLKIFTIAQFIKSISHIEMGGGGSFAVVTLYLHFKFSNVCSYLQ